jgi:hypothetical protein
MKKTKSKFRSGTVFEQLRPLTQRSNHIRDARAWAEGLFPFSSFHKPVLIPISRWSE